MIYHPQCEFNIKLFPYSTLYSQYLTWKCLILNDVCKLTTYTIDYHTQMQKCMHQIMNEFREKFIRFCANPKWNEYMIFSRISGNATWKLNYYTYVGRTYSDSNLVIQILEVRLLKCENFRSFLPLIFYVKSILAKCRVTKLEFWQFQNSEFWVVANFSSDKM